MENFETSPFFKKNWPTVIALFSILLFVIGFISGCSGFQSSKNTVAPAIEGISVVKPNIVVQSSGLSKVEIWAVPTGTNLTEDQYQLLRQAVLESDVDGKQVWKYTYSSTPLSVTEIFAKGYDEDGNEVGKVSLPYQGVTELSEALWGNQ